MCIYIYTHHIDGAYQWSYNIDVLKCLELKQGAAGCFSDESSWLSGKVSQGGNCPPVVQAPSEWICSWPWGRGAKSQILSGLIMKGSPPKETKQTGESELRNRANRLRYCIRKGCGSLSMTLPTNQKLGPPVVPFYPFLGGRVTKIDYSKKGTLILTSLLD